MTHTFTVVWPILDEGVTTKQLLEEAREDLPRLLRTCHGKLVGPGRFQIKPARAVAGSGGVSEHVLTFEAPAVPVPRRVYHLPAVGGSS